MNHNLKFGVVLSQPAILKISAFLGKTNTKLEFLNIVALYIYQHKHDETVNFCFKLFFNRVLTHVH